MASFKSIAARSQARRCRECGTFTTRQIEYTGGREDGQRFSNCRAEPCISKAAAR